MENCDDPGACLGQKKVWAVISIIFYVFVICFVTLILFIYQFKDTIVNDIDKYRCRPYFMPFVSMFTDKSGVDNFNECVFGTAKTYVNDYSSEINKMMDEQQAKVNDADASVQNLDQNLAEWQIYLTEMQNKKDAKQNHINLIIKYIGIKIQHFFSKIVAGLLSFYYFLLSMFNVCLAMVQLPLKMIPALLIIGASLATITSPLISTGAGALLYLAIQTVVLGTAATLQTLQKVSSSRSFCCFHPNTMTEDGTQIKDIKIGDKIGKSIVKNIIVSENTEALYDYGGVLVTGDHLVWVENEKQGGGEYQRVEKCKQAIKTKIIPSEVICLITDDHKIHCVGHNNKLYQFSDYQETSSNLVHCQAAKLILKDLNANSNKDTINSRFEDGEESYGLDPKTNVIMNDNSIKEIGSIEMGDLLLGGNRVIGTMSGKAGMMKCFIHHGKVFSSRQIIHDDDKNLWRKVYRMDKSVFDSISLNSNICHLITSKGEFIVDGNIRIRDFRETSNEKVNQEIDNLSIPFF